MSKTSCIQLPANDNFTVTRQCYLNLLGKNECAAKLLDFFVNFHDKKMVMGWFRPGEPILQDHTEKDLSDVRLLGTFGVQTIRKSIQQLVDLGFLKIHSNPNPRYKGDRTKHYELFPAEIQKALNKAETRMETQSVKVPIDAVKVPIDAVKVPTLNNEPKILPKILTQDTPQHTPPTSSEKSANADVCVDGYLEVEIVEPETEPEQSTHTAQSDSSNSSLAVSAISGGGELSRGCSIIPDRSMATANFDNRMRYALTPARIAETASKVLSMFNAGKPLYWKSLGVVQKPLKEHCEKYIKDYLREGKEADEAIGLFEDDFKYSLIGLKTSKFHTSKDFENGNIYWLLEKDRVYKHSCVGRSLSTTEQAIVADKLIGDTTAKVIRDFHNGKVLSDIDMYFRRNSYRKLLKKQDPDAPTIEYLQENFPELLTELTENK